MATFDYLSREEAKVVVGLGPQDGTKDAILDRAVAALSDRLDRIVGPVVRRAYSDVEVAATGLRSVEVRGPVTSFASVVEYPLPGLGTSTVLTRQSAQTVPTDGYLAERHGPDPQLFSGVVRRVVNGWPSSFLGPLVVTYTAGRADSTPAVPAQFKEACGVALRNWWRQWEQQVAYAGEFEVPQRNFPTFAIPHASREILGHEVQVEAGFG